MSFQWELSVNITYQLSQVYKIYRVQQQGLLVPTLEDRAADLMCLSISLIVKTILW